MGKRGSVAKRLAPAPSDPQRGDAMSALTDRMLRAARLEPQLYEEVEADTTAMRDALTVVVLSSLAAGIGGGGGFSSVVMGTVVSIGGWYVWAYLTYLIGTRILPEPQTQADHGELLRTLGFANAPGVIRALGIIPGLRALSFVVAAFWMLAATVVAVRQALDYTSTLRAVGVCAIGWAIYIAVMTLLLGISS